MTSFLDCYIQALSGLSSRKRKLEPDECQTPQQHRCSLCSAVDFTYEQELIAKSNALNAFWKHIDLPGHIEPLIPSPRGRMYRTISKRKAFRIDGKVRLALMDLEDSHTPPFRPLDIIQCPIESEEHAHIYQTAQRYLEKAFSSAAAAALNYVIIKGSYTEHSVFFSLSSYNPSVSKAISRFSKLLMEACDTITAFFLFIDEGGALSSLINAEENINRFKRLIGKKEIQQTIRGRQYVYSALSHSCINLSIAEPMLATALELLAPQRSDRLYDLYCGYGVFTLEFTDRISVFIGVDPSAAAIESAKANMVKQRILTGKFVRSEIHEQTLRRIFKGSPNNEIVIYYPPKKTTTRSVIDWLAARKPRKILHIFRDIDTVATDLQRWHKRGFVSKRIVPFDSVPGLAGLELMVLLQPK